MAKIEEITDKEIETVLDKIFSVLLWKFVFYFAAVSLILIFIIGMVRTIELLSGIHVPVVVK